MTSSTGLILSLQRLSTEDGPGIRTTVFFKGCPLRCTWCHNPESLSPHPQVQWLESRCIACHTCLVFCPKGALSDSDGGIKIDRARCDGCGACAQECPSNALELLGRQIGVDELLSELFKDRAYYEKSGGGVTLSGGEPTQQASFSADLLYKLKEAGISTALDTCGLCSPQVLERLLPCVDLMLFDLKLLDPELHKKYTGQSNDLILANLERIAAAGKRIWIRTPLIPGATDSIANIQAIGSYLALRFTDRVERWELCAFNNLCRDKYRRLGLDWPYTAAPLVTSWALAEIEACARNSGFDPQRIYVTGLARVEA
jgi:pyruvate formate lyase activating enzyme